VNQKKKAALYCRVSTGDQHLETQLLDLREMARQRGYEIVDEFTDIISGTKSKRPGLDQLMADARRHRFDIVLVAAFDRIARNVRHFLDVLDELNHLGIEFVSNRENIATSGPLGRAMLTTVGAISELERSLIVERVRAGMRRAKLEGRRIGRAPLDIDRQQVVADRRSRMSLSAVAKRHHVSRATVCRLVNEARGLESHAGNLEKAIQEGRGESQFPGSALIGSRAAFCGLADDLSVTVALIALGEFFQCNNRFERTGLLNAKRGSGGG
jgi:DNA invertase Pin-like site-specific DNA recombinase